MNILALDTATEACSAALWQDGQVLARFHHAGRSHTELMLPMVHGLMADAGCAFTQLDGIACGIGPGSFAGVRIGVGFVKGLALALDVPVAGVSSLAMLAQGAINHGAQQVLAVIDARITEVYLGAYTRSASGLAALLAPEQVCKPETASAAPGDWAAVGSGWATYADALKQSLQLSPLSIDGAALPRAEDALRLALPLFQAGLGISADVLLPNYLRDKVALTLTEQRELRR